MKKDAEMEERTQTGADDQTVELSRPLPDGKETLTLDFDKVSGYTLLRCEKAAKKEDASIVVPALSQVYQAHVAAIAANVKYDDILALSAKDFTAVMIKTQGFLLGTGSQDKEED
ncbi:hypothetical protein [Megasphaera elsdenii]|uniref:hypothetical protein n=1 Tax=Megasphaera elsdenii TaxID=907 RepID=UPI00339582AA